MAETINQIMDRIKNLQEFTIEVDLPEGFKLHGSIPYDTKISNNKAKFNVYAVSYDEAYTKVNQYIEKLTTK
jgi:hypothetical protein